MERKWPFALAALVAMLATSAAAPTKDYDILFKYDGFNLCKYDKEAKSYLKRCTGKRPVVNEVGYNFLGILDYAPAESTFIFLEGSAEWNAKMTSWRMDTNDSGEIISVVDFVYFDMADSSPVGTKLVLAETYANVIRIERQALYFAGELHSVKYTSDKPIRYSGSAVAVSDSVIVTNSHVVSDLALATTGLRLDGKRVETGLGFEIIAKRDDAAKRGDSAPDLAIVKVRDGGLHACAISDASPVLGERVDVWGYPRNRGVGVTATRGIVSGKNGFLGDTRMFEIMTFLRPGNSGGPVVQNGKIIGLATAVLVGHDNVAFAIKSENIRNMLDLHGVKANPTTENIEECTYKIIGLNKPDSTTRDQTK